MLYGEIMAVAHDARSQETKKMCTRLLHRAWENFIYRFNLDECHSLEDYCMPPLTPHLRADLKVLHFQEPSWNFVTLSVSHLQDRQKKT